MTPEDVQALMRDELASLGGHLLATYGDQRLDTGGMLAAPHPLGTLGGYLLEEYGKERASDDH